MTTVETDSPTSEEPRENTGYNCEVSGHIFGQWMAQSKTETRRVCVIPWCRFVHMKKAAKA